MLDVYIVLASFGSLSCCMLSEGLFIYNDYADNFILYIMHDVSADFFPHPTFSQIGDCTEP